MKKAIFIGLGCFFLLLFSLAIVIYMKPTLGVSFWLDEGDLGFKNPNDIRSVLKQTIPEREYILLRYYKLHKNPILKNSIYVEYFDESFKLDNTLKYSNDADDSGEFTVLGKALCSSNELREKYGFNAITFHVVSSKTGKRMFYEHNWACQSLAPKIRRIFFGFGTQ